MDKKSLQDKIKKRPLANKIKNKNLEQGDSKNLEQGSSTIDELNKLLDQKNLQCEKLLDSLQRMTAEFDNFRKRSEREKTNIYNQAVIDLILKILPVLDNLERALKSLNDQGLELVYKQFKSLLEDLDVQEIMINPGDDFNLELHEAVAHVQDDSLGENKIFDVFEKGYTLNNKTIRYAKVRVAN